MSVSPRISFSPDALTEVCRTWHVKRLSFFGSVVREDFDEKSDVDVLIEFKPGHSPSLISIERLRSELSTLFGGRQVDLVTPASLKSRIRERVMDGALEQYAA